MSKLIAQLDGLVNSHETQGHPWQTYTLQRGKKLTEVLVPLKNSLKFEAELKQPGLSDLDLLEILTRYGGELRS